MLSQDQGFDVHGINIQPARQMDSEAQAVQKCPAAQNMCESGPADKISQRIRWIGENQDDGVRGCAPELGKDALVNARIRIQQLQPAGRIASIRRPAGLFIDSGGDHDQGRAGQIRIISVTDVHRLRRQRCAVLQVGRNRLGPLAVTVQHDDLTSTFPHNH